VGQVYSFDAATGVYSIGTADGTVPPKATFANGLCTDALQEVVYNVYLKTNVADNVSRTSYYTIESIVADVVT